MPFGTVLAVKVPKKYRFAIPSSFARKTSKFVTFERKFWKLRRFFRCPEKAWISSPGAPFFCLFAGRGHAVRLFYFLCSCLNFKNLCKIRENGEFSFFAFRCIKNDDSPPNSPFAMCRGHMNFKSHK